MNGVVRYWMVSRTICVTVSCLMFFGCWSAADGTTKAADSTQVARLGLPFNLRAGREIAFKGERLRIKFAAVDQDSRCPSDGTCLWGGNAAVRVEARTSGKDRTSLTLNTGKNASLANEMQYHGYKVKLISLSPYPTSRQRIAARDYVVTLLVSKE